MTLALIDKKISDELRELGIDHEFEMEYDGEKNELIFKNKIRFEKLIEMLNGPEVSKNNS